MGRPVIGEIFQQKDLSVVTRIAAMSWPVGRPWYECLLEQEFLQFSTRVAWMKYN